MMPAIDTLQDFKNRVETFLRETGLAESAFGVRACGDGSFVDDLRRGREPRRRTIERVCRFMDEWAETRSRPAA